jgi:glycosyltransferase involved in cell wall biosynthesis
MKVALVHDWLTGMRGGEKVLEVLCELFPSADLFTLFHFRGSVSPLIERHHIETSFLQRLPFPERHYRRLLPLFPRGIESFRVDGYDLVVSSSHCVAKSVKVPADVPHVCYCHSPMRYAWDQFDAYFGPERVGSLKSRLLYKPILTRLARWDARTASRVRRFVANSSYVAGRIRRYYNRAAAIVHPPVDTDFFAPGAEAPEPHFLVVSALVPYKRIDLAIDACTRAGHPLRIIGEGPDRGRLEAGASPLVTFLGPLSGATLRNEYRRAAAVLLPGEEDFGIVPVEAQACGTPVVAFGRGGALETVRHGETGVLFEEATAASLAAALDAVTRLPRDPQRLHAHATQFSTARHRAALTAVLDETLAAPRGTTW